MTVLIALAAFAAGIGIGLFAADVVRWIFRAADAGEADFHRDQLHSEFWDNQRRGGK